MSPKYSSEQIKQLMDKRMSKENTENCLFLYLLVIFHKNDSYALEFSYVFNFNFLSPF